MSTSAASTCWCSVIPRPVRPRTPKDQVSSRMRRNLYLSLSSIWQGRSDAAFRVERCATDNFRQINHITNILKQALRDNEPPRQRLLRLLFRDFRQNSLQVLHIIVFIPSYRTPRDLEPFLDRIVHRFIRNDDISSFRESW